MEICQEEDRVKGRALSQTTTTEAEALALSKVQVYINDRGFHKRGGPAKARKRRVSLRKGEGRRALTLVGPL